jgi:hypothetical protein
VVVALASACGDDAASLPPDGASFPDAGLDAGPDASGWPPRVLELCGARDPAATFQPGYLTRGVSELTLTTGVDLRAGDAVAAGFAPPHPFRLERLWLRLTGVGSVRVAVLGDHLGEQPDPAVILVAEQTIVVQGERWYAVEGFPPVTFVPAERFWVGVTFTGAGVDVLAGPAPGGWDRFRLPDQTGAAWAPGFESHALAVHAEGTFLCPVHETGFVDRRGEAGLAGQDFLYVQLVDLDGDGFDEILGMYFATPVVHWNRGGLRFEAEPLAPLPGVRTSLLAADVDNDGDQDVFVGVWETAGSPDPGARAVLLVNDGAGGLTSHPASGLERGGQNAAGAFVDFDRDGVVDLYVGNLGGGQGYADDWLFRGLGDGTFEEVGAAAGLLAAGPGPTFGVAFCDVDDDGWPDALVAQQAREPNRLWRNLGDGTFAEVGAQVGLATDGVGTHGGNSLMLECGDHDNDGHLDLMVGENAEVADPTVDLPRLLRWTAGGALGFRFEDVTAAAGLAVTRSMFDPAWADFDNDGDLDLVVCGEPAPTQGIRLLRNEGDGTFTDVTYEAGIRAPHGSVAAWSDLDGDGDLDLLAYSYGRGTVLLYENRLAPGTRWIQLHLVGVPPSNRDALGARVTAVTGDLRQTRELGGAAGSRLNGGSRVVHLGFGDHVEPLELEVRWPSGRVEQFTGLADRARHTLVEGTGEPLL